MGIRTSQLRLIFRSRTMGKGGEEPKRRKVKTRARAPQVVFTRMVALTIGKVRERTRIVGTKMVGITIGTGQRREVVGTPQIAKEPVICTRMIAMGQQEEAVGTRMVA